MVRRWQLPPCPRSTNRTGMMAPTWPEHSQRDRVCFHRSEKNRNCFHPACHRFNFLLSHQASQKNAPRSLKKRAVSDFSVTNITVTKKTETISSLGRLNTQQLSAAFSECCPGQTRRLEVFQRGGGQRAKKQTYLNPDSKQLLHNSSLQDAFSCFTVAASEGLNTKV